MIYLPFIYFSILLMLILRHKKRFDLSALLTSSYLTTSLFAIIVDYLDLYGFAGCVEADKNLAPSILYCLLITITIIPFINLPLIRQSNWVPIRNIWMFKWVVYFYWVIFFLIILFFGGEVVRRFQIQDIGSLRNQYASEGDDLGFSNYSGLVRLLARFSFIFGSASIFLQVLYFYSLAFLKYKNTFNIGILILSLISVILSFLTFDRSKIAYWILSFIALSIFFWPILHAKRQKRLKVSFSIFVSISLTYIIAVTTARYGEHDFGAGYSVVAYLGQPYNNFCLFYEELDFNGLSFEYLTPTVYIFLDYFGIHRPIVRAYPIDTNVFATFAGMLIREIGVVATIAYCGFYSVVSTLILRRLPKYNIFKIFLIVIFFYLPYFGIFGLFYSSFEREFSVVAVLVMCYFFCSKFR